MKNLIYKEFKLSASALSFLFLAFSLLALVPGYPILVGIFFICMGIFQSFAKSRENNDILYTVLLPIKKSDAVKAKYAFVLVIEFLSFLLCAAAAALRTFCLSSSEVYKHNVLMNANLVYLGFVLLIFAAFNLVFLNGFFKTAYYYGKPFVMFIVAAFLIVAAAETLHHLPGLEFLNGAADADTPKRAVFFIICTAVFAAVTALALKSSKKRFSNIDL